MTLKGEDAVYTAQRLAELINFEAANMPMAFMEVCGTHTMAIARNGIKSLLPECIRLISGPGCPVCVTSNEFLDKAIALAERSDVIICTFGDMIRVPGSRCSLEEQRGLGSDIRIVGSTLDALALADKNRDKDIVFLGIGFETTAPTVAAAIIEAYNKRLDNFSVLCAHKVMPQPMKALSESSLNIDGYILPGHVSAIIGEAPYSFLADDYNKACVISGFEPLDILESILRLVRQVRKGFFFIENQYVRVVKPQGNPTAQELLSQVFEPADAEWRGLGIIADSGLAIRDEYAQFDADKKYQISIAPPIEPPGCRCGEVLTGSITPDLCGLFGTSCTPMHPVGACMVSSEGSCAAHYRYTLRDA
ncbi:hydrogenase formation protein HypD [bacterium]|nr:hydrogenase formation protein HypD [bacterium]